MTLLNLTAAPSLQAQHDYALGFEHVKTAAAATATYSLAGRLYASKSGWILLSVPNAVVRGLFDALSEPGAELPLDSEGQLNAHVSVFRKEELAALGGPDKIQERGGQFHFQLGPLKSCEPAGWPEMSKVWMVSITSPELSQLRRTYGLPSLPTRNGEELPFHLTVAVRRKSVLGANEVSKAADLASDIAASAAACEEPKSPEQAEAGNYRKGHIKLHGFDITIETAKGMIRRGVSPDGHAWQHTLGAHYGYIKKTLSEADGDHVDVFVGPDPESELVFAVDQIDPKTGKFDEHKIMLGYHNEAAARAGYLQNYSDDWKGLGNISPLTLPQFKAWLRDGDTAEPLVKQATKSTLAYLREAKLKSDEKDYSGKNRILQEIMRRDPSAWNVDTPGKLAGVTHTPTGFRFHMPIGLIVPGIRNSR